MEEHVTSLNMSAPSVKTNCIRLYPLSVEEHVTCIENMSTRAGCLNLHILAECRTTKARVCGLTLPHYTVDTPVFMPVGTQGTMKGLTTEQLQTIDCHIILANTYHIGHRPGVDVIKKAGGLHTLMKWPRAMLTDSGGFQMVSLLKLSEVTEEGVCFQSPHDGSQMMLTPEKSMEIQNTIGADIIMQLDDVVHSTTTGTRLTEATHRSVRWLDRCIKSQNNPNTQNLFAIIQGGLDAELRKSCLKAMVERETPGYAIGGLSGGEEKCYFWRMVTLCTDYLPRNKPRYLMGVGYAVDLVVCCALGCDMFDCVFPTRTARFGTALVPTGQLNLRQTQFAADHRPIDTHCRCLTCSKYTRSYLHSITNQQTVSCHLITIHNLTYQMDLMRGIRESISNNSFPQFITSFMSAMYPDKQYPDWAVEALASVNVKL